jgi:DNA modification methylase
MTDFKNEQVWLMQGDCLERMKEIPDGSVDLVLCDPPYGTTACKWDSIIDLELMWDQLKRVIKPNGAIVLFGSEPFSSVLRVSNLKNFKYDWIWNKEKGANIGVLKHQPSKVHENISVFSYKTHIYNPLMEKRPEKNKRNNKPRFNKVGIQGEGNFFVEKSRGNLDFKYPTSVKFFNTVRGGIHPTQKPVELMEYMIKTYTNEDETVLDFTMGSGSTIKAALNTNRKSIGIEMGKCEKKGHKYEGVDWTDVLIDQLDLTKETT